MPKLNSEEIVKVNALVDKLFTNRYTERTEQFESLVVDVPDEDGYAGWLANLRFIGVVRESGLVTLEADYVNRRPRRWQRAVLDFASGELSAELELDGQASLLPIDPESILPSFKAELAEARYGVPYRVIIHDEDAHFQNERLRAAVLIEA